MEDLPESELGTSISERVGGLRDDGRVTEEEMDELVLRGWRYRAFRPEEASESGDSDRQVLVAHDPETINSHKA